MECDRYIENGQGIVSTPQAWACGVKRKFGDGGMRVGGPGGRSAGPGRVLAPGALLEGSAMLAGGISASPRRRPEPRPTPRAPLPRVVSDSPFMNNMDEITFWIVTKRAPCLAGYNNPLRRVQPQCSRAPLHSASPDDQGEPERKRKKLVVLNDDSDTLDQTNVEAPPQPVCEVISDDSETLVSDVDFNIKKSSVQIKNKKTKAQKKSNRGALHKKNKVVTSTPKVTSNLRRSLRKVQSSVNNNSHLNSTLDIFDTSDGNNHAIVPKCIQAGKFEEDTKLINLSNREPNATTCAVSVPRPNNGVINGQFDDLSDVSGFTANYIKSTKINSKTPRKVRSKPSRNLAKESRHSAQKEEKSLIVSINKATGDPKTNILNCSTDSSQNIINLVTVDKKSRTKKLDKSTSLLKFMESKRGQKVVNVKSECRNGVLNKSFQSTSTTGSRYPKRHKNNSSDVLMVEISEKTEPSKLSSDKRTATNQSSRLESTELVSRTRSGRSRHSKLTEPTVYVRSNFPEQESTVATINVANAVLDEAKASAKKKRPSSKSGVARKFLNKTGQSNKDSFREKSGFAACFSDSDDDKPLKPQKYLS
ncbi:uncharacterized protein LOC125226950 [Leguminivora glycinivorella]|uniref:uncharacterized protein LOC125226950 n=1 Tax=Leguminivora glycinivorella TaxID=1035111 RepID=UPI00200CA148|nr:uncharacterized protein LOC125226950 [Leguminivora glycinivorella]